jgi:G3E family GTPase
VVETTGLADPAPIAQTLLIDPMLRNQVRLANIVTTVDGMLGAGQLGTHKESLRQAAVADRLVITKTDMIDSQDAEKLKRALTRLNPTARIFDVNSTAFDAEALLTNGISDPATKPPKFSTGSRAPKTATRTVTTAISAITTTATISISAAITPSTFSPSRCALKRTWTGRPSEFG